MEYYGVTLDDLQGLPQAILVELNSKAGFALEWEIVSVINTLGGVASVDKITVAYWREHQKVLERAVLNAKLYRMKNKGLIDSVVGAKGVYATNKNSRLMDCVKGESDGHQSDFSNDTTGNHGTEPSGVSASTDR